jgi:hypothetical protein
MGDTLEVIILFCFPLIPYLVFFIYAMRKISKEKKAAKSL